MSLHRRARRAAAAAVAAAVGLAGCAVAEAGTTAEAPATASAAPGTALEALAGITVKGRAPRTGYDRDLFGSGWVDVDRNGCDTRNDVLARDLARESFVPGTRDCVVAAGELLEPYSGRTLAFVRGEGTSELVQVDHVVALSDAWQKGAQRWTPDQRTAFANDPLNLLAVDGPLNAAKGDADAATWLPPATGSRCAYVARQVAVKAAHGLWMTGAERDAVARVLDTCPDEPLPAPTGQAVPGAPDAPAAEPAPAGPEPSYGSCAEVRAAGAAPIAAGDPGFRPALDRDGDGVACEG